MTQALAHSALWDQLGPEAIARYAIKVCDAAHAEVPALQTLQGQQRWGEVADLAHKLKGRCLTIGAQALGESMIALEAAARDQDAQAVAALVEALPGQVAALRAAAQTIG